MGGDLSDLFWNRSVKSASGKNKETNDKLNLLSIERYFGICFPLQSRVNSVLLIVQDLQIVCTVFYLILARAFVEKIISPKSL